MEVIGPGDYIWKPNKKQELALSVPDTVKELFYGGSVFGGKTEYLLHLPIARSWHEHPRFSAIYFRESFPELNKSLIARAQILYPKFGAKYNGQDHVFKFPSGAKVWFDYLEKDSDAHKHDTDEYNLIVFEELTAFTEYMYLYFFLRCRTSTPDLPAIMRSASNPLGKGHMFVRKRFIDPCRSGGQIINDGGTKRIFIPASAKDNPDGLKNNPGYLNDLRHLPAYLYKAKVEGDWYVISGQAFPEFRDKLYPGEPSNAVHVIPAFRIPDFWPKIISVDWGYTHKTSIGWLAISPEGRVYVYRVYNRTKTSIATWASEVAALSQYDKNIASVELDPSAWQNRGLEKTIHEQFMESSGFYPNQADNDRVGGKLNLHEMLRFTPLPPKFTPAEGFSSEMADRIFRMHGEAARNEYIKTFQPDPPETNIPILQIFDVSENRSLIETIPLCQIDESRPEDIAKFDGDDDYDMLRYGCKAIERYKIECKKEFENIMEMSKLLELQKTDPTSFYIHMREHESTKQTGPIRAFHSGSNKRTYSSGYKGRIH